MKIISDVPLFLQLSLAHKEEYPVLVMGRRILAHPQVMSPKYSYAPQFFVKHWDIAKGMSVLDVGTGSGILAIFAALQGASEVVAVDINPYAVQLAQKNVQSHGLGDVVTVRASDMFCAVGEQKFDRILFAAPYSNKKPDSRVPLTYGVYDEGYGAARAFLSQAKHHLKSDGKILLGFALFDDVVLMETIIRDSGLQVERIAMEKKGHTRVLYYLVP